MIPRPGVATAFAALGLSDWCVSVWSVILDGPSATMKDVCEGTGLRASHVETAIREMLEVGVLRPQGSAPLKVVAADPSVVIETHIARRERDLAVSADRIAALREIMPELRRRYARDRVRERPESGIELVETLDGVRREVYLAADRVRMDIRSLEPDGPSPVDHLAAMDDAQRTQFETLARGICDRNIIDQQILNDPQVTARRADLRARGGLVRTLPKVSGRVTIFDRDLAVMAVDPTDNARGALLIRIPSLIDSLIFMFDCLWATARPVFELDHEAVPTARGPRILEFMAAGMKDDRIARALGVGPRTIRRDISVLKDTLGVSTRTEIVAAAAKRGWI